MVPDSQFSLSRWLNKCSEFPANLQMVNLIENTCYKSIIIGV